MQLAQAPKIFPPLSPHANNSWSDNEFELGVKTQVAN